MSHWRSSAQKTRSYHFVVILLFFLLAACDSSNPTDSTVCDFGDSATHRVVGLGNGSLTVTFPLYLIKIQFGSPFGIVLLETVTQPRNFAHPELPLADWEWFWFDDDGGGNLNKQTKLIQPNWDSPIVSERPDSVMAFFRRDEALGALNLNLEVDYMLYPDTRFDVVYRIKNNSQQSITKPYAMVGFPGFSNPGWINEVGNMVETRTPSSSFYNFQQEILSQNRAESTLLWHDWTPGFQDTLHSTITVKAFGGTYELQTAYLPDADVAQVSSGHVVKPAYLTSHLYVNFQDIPPGMSRSLRIHYRLRDYTWKSE